MFRAGLKVFVTVLAVSAYLNYADKYDEAVLFIGLPALILVAGAIVETVNKK
jgi:hypothetical protein